MDINAHRKIAIDAYNDCWDLLESPRSEQQDRDLIGLAFLSRAHWALAGGNREFAIADWMVSRVCAAAQHGALAVSFARASLDIDDSDFPAWLKASLHEGMARACAADGQQDLFKQYVASARYILSTETDLEAVAVIATQIAELE